MRDLMVLKTNWSRNLTIRMDLTIGWSDGKRRNEESPFDIRNSLPEICIEKVVFSSGRKDSNDLQFGSE